MTELLLVLGVFALAWTVGAVAVVHRLRRSNAVGRRVGGAPLCWLASPGVAAQLHRRLRGAVVAVRITVPVPRRRAPRDAFHEVADDLEQQAVAIDAELVAVRRLPLAHRREAHRFVAVRVAEIERLAAGIVLTAGGAGYRVTLDGLGARIDALQQAHAELGQLERSVGLRATG
jgi:hypothetical protein